MSSVDVQSLKIDREPKSSGRRRRSGGSPWFGRAIVLVILLGLGFLLRQPILDAVNRFSLPTVDVYEIVESTGLETAAVSGTAANGYVVAERRAALSADTPGRIVELNVTEGSRVKKGDVVARLFQGEVRSALDRAAAEFATAEARVEASGAALRTAGAVVDQRKSNREALASDLAEAEAQAKLASLRFERSRQLFESGVSSQDLLDEAESALRAADARVAATVSRRDASDSAVRDAETRVGQAEADLDVALAQVEERRAARDLAKATLEKTEIIAPFDGVVVLKDAEIGEVVSPNSQGGSNARGSICTMVDRASLEVQAEVPEKSLTAVRLGGRVEIFPDADPSRRYRGTVDRIWPTADRQKATIEVRAKFEQIDEFLIPDMGVRIVFLPEDAESTEPGERVEKPAGTVIPTSALVKGPNGESGVLVFERGVARFRALEVLERTARRIRVGEGLEPGELVILDPPADLSDGDRAQRADAD